jgi:hypothetical protein
MNELLAIVAAAALFTGLGLLERKRPPRGCQACGHSQSEACDSCPLTPTETQW